MEVFFGKGGVMSKNRTRRIRSLTRTDIEKGQKSENLVEESLRLLADSGEIHHYHRAMPDGELDQQGIDFLVFLQPATIGPLQVKSSARGREKHIAEHNSQIPCVATDLYSDLSELTEAVRQALGISVMFLEPFRPVIEEIAQEMKKERLNQFPALA